MSLPLSGRTALVTGVSRRRGIGYAVASRLAAMGASLAVHHHLAHDADEYGAGEDLDRLLDDLRGSLQGEARLVDVAADLGDPAAVEALVATASRLAGHLDVLVCNHAHGGDAVDLAHLTVAALDRHWQVNARATLLLTQAFAAQHDGRPGGRVIWMTSGQQLGPMSDTSRTPCRRRRWRAPLVASRTTWLGRGILLNTVNPGPVNTGYLDDAPPAFVRAPFPLGRIGEPEDPARLIGWLVSDEGSWVVGQVLDSEGGFRR